MKSLDVLISGFVREREGLGRGLRGGERVFSLRRTCRQWETFAAGAPRSLPLVMLALVERRYINGNLIKQ